MGEVHNLKLKKGETVRIWTGGALPAGADAVVMVDTRRVRSEYRRNPEGRGPIR